MNPMSSGAKASVPSRASSGLSTLSSPTSTHENARQIHRNLRELTAIAQPFHAFFDFDISVIVRIKLKLRLVVPKAFRVSRNTASSGRRLELNRDNFCDRPSRSVCWTMLRNGVIPISPTGNMAGFARFMFRVRGPAAGPIFSCAVNGTRLSERSKAVSHMRVVKIILFAKGGRALENVSVFSLALVFNRSVRVASVNWPAPKLNPDGFSK